MIKYFEVNLLNELIFDRLLNKQNFKFPEH